MRLASVLGLVLAFASGARAAEIYRQDFQKGVAPEWAASGEGDVRLTAYDANISLRVAGHARSRVEVVTSGWRDVILRLKLAAFDLAPEDGCYAEVSGDGGRSWRAALVVRKGQDDGVSFVSATFHDPLMDDRPRLLIRLRADLSRGDGACWADDARLTGDAPAPRRAAPLDISALRGPRLEGLSSVAAFMAGADQAAPAPVFEGRLSLRPRAVPDGVLVLTDAEPRRPDRRGAWPDLDIDLVQDGHRLIPAARGPIASPNPEWEWVVEPGRVWTDAADQGFSRAVLPVALEERNANCLHNGRLLILMGPDGEVSKAAVQFDADTCDYYRFDAWSLVPAVWKPAPVAGREAVIARDRASRMATSSLAALREAHPSLDLDALARAAGPFAVWGLDDGRTHYAAPCETRAGEDLLCAERDLPSYSTAKSLVGAQALLRLEALKPGIVNETVAAHVPACAARGGWDDVRLIDLLDMASGHFRLSGALADEDSRGMNAFFQSTTARAKVDFACAEPRKAAPGKVFTYHTADSFLLGVAMTDALRRSGDGADIYSDLIRPIWRAIGESPTLDVTRRTYDAEAQPFTGWGLTYTRNDVVRAARFLADGGEVGVKPYLEPALLSEALQKSRPGSGLEASGPHFRYRHGFWARDIAPLIGCAHAVWTPFLSGYGGISIVLFPNDVRFYAFNDEDHFDWAQAAIEINKIRPLCA